MPRRKETKKMKTWYEDKESFYRALARLATRLSRWLLNQAAWLYDEVGDAGEAEGLRQAASAVPQPRATGMLGEPQTRQSHPGLGWELADTLHGDEGWPTLPGR